MAQVDLQTSPVPVADIDATGTPDSSTFLRGDGAWAEPSGSGGGVNPGRAETSGDTSYWLPGVNLIATKEATSFGAQGAGGILYFPIVIAESVTIAGLAAEVMSGQSAGRLTRIGIYKADFDWQPTELVGEGEIDCSSTGVKTVAIAETLTPGRHVLALSENNTAINWRVQRGLLNSIKLGTNNFIHALYVQRSYAALPETPLAYDTIGTSSGAMGYPVFIEV